MTIITNDGESFIGSRLTDLVTLISNGGYIDGAGGNDRLSASLLLQDSEYEHVSGTLLGGAGDDVIDADVIHSGDGEAPSIDLTLDGGTGNDVIGAGIEATYNNAYSVVASGGSGNDHISVFARGEDSASARAEIDGGSGDDVIALNFLDVGYFGFNDDGIININAGSGDDSIDSFVRSPTGDLYSNIRGENGDDDIVATVYASGTQELGGGSSLAAAGGAGNDTMTLSSVSDSGNASMQAWGDGGDDTITATTQSYASFDDTRSTSDIYGGDGADRITARIEVDLFDWDTAYAANVVHGDAGDDWISASINSNDIPKGDYHSELYGGEGDDRLSVKGGDGNRLEGNQGDDVLLGSSGSDRLIGGQGDDYLRGRGGADEFVFGSIRAGERDRVADFAIGEDVIDLSGIDANAFRSGNQAFRFSEREGTGRAWIEQSDGSSSILHADNGRQVLEVVLIDGRDVGPGDYSAGDFLL